VFDLNHEKNLPTYFSSLLLLTSSVLLGTIAIESRMHENSRFFFWALLAAIFLFLSFDEVFMIHERFRKPVQSRLNTSGLFNFAWVIPYGCATIFFAFFFLKFVLNLPKKVKFLFILGGVMYVSGAIGMEMIGGLWDENFGQDNATYAMLYTIEESLELTGIIVFIFGLLTYMTDTIGGVRFRIVSDS
jgi:hypothetical protein